MSKTLITNRFIFKKNVDIWRKWTHHRPEPPHQTGNCHRTCSDLHKEVTLSTPDPFINNDNSWPEGGSSAHHWFGSLKRWCTVSCTCFCFYAGTKPPAVVSLFSPPSCIAAAGSSSVVYWDAPPGRVCGPLHKSADEQPSLFPTFAARYPVKKQTNKQTNLKFSPFEKKRIVADFCFNNDGFFLHLFISKDQPFVQFEWSSDSPPDMWRILIRHQRIVWRHLTRQLLLIQKICNPTAQSKYTITCVCVWIEETLTASLMQSCLSSSRQSSRRSSRDWCFSFRALVWVVRSFNEDVGLSGPAMNASERKRS